MKFIKYFLLTPFIMAYYYFTSPVAALIIFAAISAGISGDEEYGKKLANTIDKLWVR